MELAPKKTGLSTARLERITELLERDYLATGKMVGAQLAIARHGHLAYLRSFGQMDRERGKPMTDGAIFRIHSMSKPISSVALMTLYERGHFQLNDPVSRFFPDWKQHQVWVSGGGKDMITEAPHRAPTMRDMLCHTGGIAFWNRLGPPANPVEEVYAELRVREEAETLQSFAEKLAKVPLLYQPGERWMYSSATNVVGALVEKISGQRFDKFLKEHIFEPLGMKDTGFYVPPEKVGRFTACYGRGPDGPLKLVDDPTTSLNLKEPVFFNAASGLVGSTEDYLRFSEMLRRGGELDGERVLGPRTVALMHRNHLKDGQDLSQMSAGGRSETSQAGVGFGLGFASVLDEVKAGSISVGDYYWGGASSTIFWVDAVQDLSVVFMVQLMPGGYDFRGELKNIIYSSIVE